MQKPKENENFLKEILSDKKEIKHIDFIWKSPLKFTKIHSQQELLRRSNSKIYIKKNLGKSLINIKK